MDFPPKKWIFPSDFGQRCAIIIESFEAGNTNVFKGFPIIFNSGTRHTWVENSLSTEPKVTGSSPVGCTRVLPLKNRCLQHFLEFGCMGY